MPTLITERLPVELERMRWSRERYHEAIQANILREDDKVELIAGELLMEGLRDRMPQNVHHRTAVAQLTAVLGDLFRPQSHVCAQLPLPLLGDSEPEPDIAVIEGSPADYKDLPPETAELIVEVSDSSLAYDRTYKGSLYAAAGIDDYWIVNIPDRVLEVYRAPEQAVDEPFGWRYSIRVDLRRGENVTPLARSAAFIAVADILL